MKPINIQEVWVEHGETDRLHVGIRDELYAVPLFFFSAWFIWIYIKGNLIGKMSMVFQLGEETSMTPHFAEGTNVMAKNAGSVSSSNKVKEHSEKKWD